MKNAQECWIQYRVNHFSYWTISFQLMIWDSVKTNKGPFSNKINIWNKYDNFEKLCRKNDDFSAES